MIQPYNFHTHTYRCNHALGDVDDYIAIARAGGCMVLGFSEHTCHPRDCSGLGRLQLAELPHYKIAIEQARLKNPDMRIPMGMECEWRPEWKAFYLALGCDYLIGSVHVADPGKTNIQRYTEDVIATIRAGIFAFIGHPDQFWFETHQWDPVVESCARAICQEAANYDIPLEINWNRALAICGPEPHTPPFWRMAADRGCRVVINSDAHDPKNIVQHYDLMNTMRERCGLIDAGASIVPTTTATWPRR